jgi:hypothetical protein
VRRGEHRVVPHPQIAGEQGDRGCGHVNQTRQNVCPTGSV